MENVQPMQPFSGLLLFTREGKDRVDSAAWPPGESGCYPSLTSRISDLPGENELIFLPRTSHSA